MVEKKISGTVIAVVCSLCIVLAVHMSSAGSTELFPWNFFSKNVPIDTSRFPLRKVIREIELDKGYDKRKIVTATERFYLDDLETKWLDRKRPSRLYKTLKKIIDSSVEHGLDPTAYRLDEIDPYLETIYRQDDPSVERIADADVRITTRFLQFVMDISQGRARIYDDAAGKTSTELVDLLSSIERPAQLRRAVDDMHPDLEQYERLVEALSTYRELVRTYPAGTFPQLDTKMVIQPGDSNEVLLNIGKRLSLTDDEFKHDGEALFTKDMAEAVRRFQHRHGLEQDGILGPVTIQHLNVPFEEKANRIVANLDRLRWLPQARPEHYVVVNIPDFRMTVYEGKNEVMDMKVIVGDEFHPTPQLIDTLEYIAFSPTWTVPRSIIEEEFIPRLQNNAQYYNERNFKFYKNGEEIDPAEEDWDDHAPLEEYKVEQQPGPANALGAVKFMMPNALAIYLHDTPADHLFKEDDRAYSHGCIRIAEPIDFAEYLLRNQKGWDKDSIRRAMELPEPKNVLVDGLYQVQILYQTVWVDSEDVVHFRDDIYDLDQNAYAKLRLP